MIAWILFGFSMALVVWLSARCNRLRDQRDSACDGQDILRDRVLRSEADSRGLRQMLRNAEDETRRQSDDYCRIIAGLRTRLAKYDRPKGAGGKFVRKG